MINIINKKDCSGCNACEQICPKNAITMKEDKEGFIYPVIDKELCVDCGLCDKVCHIQNEYIYNKSFNNPICYAAWNLDEEERLKASSGGSFNALCDYIFSLNGIVCGVGFDKDLNVIHKFVSNKEELDELKGSKYVQSNINNTYNKTKEYLENGQVVLYTGTPCQISGLKTFLNKEYDNLYTCDLICHGVPSPKVYRKYLKSVENKENLKIKKINFRDKKTGWKNYSTKFIFNNNSNKYINLKYSNFMQGFLKDIYLRPSCYECTSSKLPRNSDITLGDFWGVGIKYPKLDDDKGTSLLLINSDKGKNLLDNCKNKLFIKECDLDYAIKYNPALVGSVNINSNREKFFEDLDGLSFDELSKKYFPIPNIFKKMYLKGRRGISKIKKVIIRRGYK